MFYSTLICFLEIFHTTVQDALLFHVYFSKEVFSPEVGKKFGSGQFKYLSYFERTCRYRRRAFLIYEYACVLAIKVKNEKHRTQNIFIDTKNHIFFLN